MAEYKQGDKFCLSDNTTIILNKQLAVGGEAYIFLVENHPNFVARLYIKSKFDIKKEEKIKKMVEIDFTIEHVTWPQKDQLIYDAKNNLVGYLMEKIDGVEVGKFLEQQKQNEKEEIAKGTNKNIAAMRRIKNMATLCRNIADKMSRLHDKNILFADINEKNLMVNPKDYTPFFIDTDSYQFEGHITAVATPGFLCPEILLDKDGSNYLAKNPRTKEHEYFALGVLFFFLLCNEIHPFSIGKPDKGIDPDMINELDGKVKLLNFILEVNKVKKDDYRGKVFDKNLGVITVWGLMPENLRMAFVTAFAKKPIQPRPKPAEWARALGEFATKLEHDINDAQLKLQQQVVHYPQGSSGQQLSAPTTTAPIPQSVPQTPITPPVNVKKSNPLLYIIYALIGVAIIVVIFWDSIFATNNVNQLLDNSASESTLVTPTPEAIAPQISPVPTPSNQSQQTKNAVRSKARQPKNKNSTKSQQPSTSDNGSSNQFGDM